MSLNARNRQRRILGLTVVDLVMRFSNQQVLAPRPTGVRASLPTFFYHLQTLESSLMVLRGILVPKFQMKLGALSCEIIRGIALFIRVI